MNKLLNVSDQFNQAFKADARKLHSRITIGNRTFSNDHIQSMIIEYGSMGGSSFGLGATFSSSLKITFANLVEGLKELDEIKVELGITLPDSTIEYAKMGAFVINERVSMDRNSDITSLEAMDKFVMLSGHYVSKLGTNARIRDIALEIANLAGVEVDGSFANLSGETVKVPIGVTYREAIGMIAHFEAGFASFNRDGKLQIRKLEDPNFRLTPNDYTSKGLVKNEILFRLNGIVCQTGDGENDVLRSGTDSGNIITIRNPSMTQSRLDNIFQELRILNYFPYTLSWYGNPALETGDWIEIEDLQGNRFKSPNLGYTLEYNGSLKASSKADTESNSEVVYEYKTPLQQEIEYIRSRVSANGRNRIYDDIAEPLNPEIGDIWFKPNGPDIELWIYGKKEDGTLGWIAKITNENLDQAKREIEEALIGLEEYKNDIDASIDDLNTTIGNNFTSLDDTMNQLSSISEQTRLNAEAARAQSLTALSDAQKAQANATDALTAARQGLSALEGVESSISAIDYEIDELNGSLSLKASQIDMNKLTGKVEQHTFDISVNAEGLKAKANQSTVDTLSGTVTTLSGELTVQAGLLRSKIGMTEVNTAIGNLEIGERNLVLKSDEKKKSSNYNFAQYTLSTPWESGIDYYIVLKAKASTTKSHIGAYANSGSYVLGSLTYDSKYDVWRGVARTIHSTTVLYLFQFPRDDALMEVEWIKVVKGTKTSYDWSQAPEDIQGQFKSMETDIEQTASAIKLKADQTTVDTLNGRVSTLNSQLTVQADQINGKVSMTDVDSAIGKLDINDRNLTKNTTSQLETVTFSGWDFYFGRYDEVKAGEEFTARIWVEPQVHDVRVMLEFGPTNSTSYYKQSAGNIIEAGGKGYVVVTASATNDGWVRQSIRHVTSQLTQNTVKYKDVKMQRGSKATDWTPAFEDVNAQISHVESEFTQKADDITATVSTLGGEVGTLKLTANGLTTSVKDAEGNIQTLQTNVNGLQSTVANKTDRSDFTQLANGFSLLSQNFNELEIDQRNFLLNTTDERTVEGQGISNQTGGNQNFVFDVPSRQLKDLPIVIGEKWVFSFDWEIRANNPTGQFTVQFNNQPYGSGMSRVNLSDTNRSGRIQHVMTVNDAWTTSTATALGFRLDNIPPGHRLVIRNFIFSKGTISPGWTPALSEVASQAQLTLLSNQINLRVSKGSLMSQINVEAGRTLIQSDKLYLDAVSVIFSGKAFIPDAAITSMTADKITAGVIDATKITVINLDARALTSGTISGANSSWNLNTGRMEFTNPGTNDTVAFTQGRILFNRGAQSRQLNYFAEGLELLNGNGNSGTGLNTSLRLGSTANGSYKYIQFSDPSHQQRLLALDNHMYLMPGNGGRVIMQIYNSNMGGSGYAGVEASYYETQHTTGNTVRMIGDRIETPRTGSRDIFLSPNGTGVVRVGNTAGDYYNIRASTFLNSSSRKLKTNIDESSQNALSVLNALTIVEYNLKSDLQMGIDNRQIGLIAEDSLLVASSDGESIDTYRLLSYNTKAIQELSSLQEKLETKIETKLFNYDSKLFNLEAKVMDLEQQIKELKGVA